MTQEVDHGANIAQMLSSRDEKIRELSASCEQTAGRNEDVEAELRELSRDHLALKIKLRSTEREHTAEIKLRDERIHEVVGFCNEQSAELRTVKAELESVKSKHEAANPLPFALHMIMCAGVSHYHNVVMQLAHGTVNRETNKVARALAEQNKIDTVIKQPSLYRSVAMYCSAINAATPNGEALREGLKAYIEANVDLFLKDPQFEVSRTMLKHVWEAHKKAAHMGSGARNICYSFDWLRVAVVDDIETLEEDDEYEELFCESLLTICLDLINHSF